MKVFTKAKVIDYLEHLIAKIDIKQSEAVGTKALIPDSPISF